jgi:LPPG:FO 2-phospho-L-lactate transferase
MGHLTLLTAGSGGLRFLAGLIDVRPEDEVHVVANVGNDCEVWGLYCCPDIDLVLHGMAGQVDPYRRDRPNGASFECFETIRKLGMPSWLRICDRDLATHLVRSDILRSGANLEDATSRLAERFGLGVRLMPPTNDPVRTTVQTAEGVLGGLEYAARGRSAPEAASIRYEGAGEARALPRVLDSILEADRVILAPADPVLGIGPILALQDVRKALARTRAGVVAISPFVGSQPARGKDGLAPHTSDAAFPVRFAERLLGLVDSLVVHTSDLPLLEAIRAAGIDAWTDNILMNSREDARRLAGRVAFPERAVARKR